MQLDLPTYPKIWRHMWMLPKVAYDCRSIEFKCHKSYFRLFNLYMKHRTLMTWHFLAIQTSKYSVKTLEYKYCFDECCICYFYAFLFSRGFMKHSTKQYLVKTRAAVHTFKNCKETIIVESCQKSRVKQNKRSTTLFFEVMKIVKQF